MSITLEQRIANLEAAAIGASNVKATPVTELSADQRIGPGVFVITKGTAAALRLPAPLVGDDDGKTLHVISATAAGHAVTTPTNGLNGNSSTATFGGSVGDSLALLAHNGVWLVSAVQNVNLS